MAASIRGGSTVSSGFLHEGVEVLTIDPTKTASAPQLSASNGMVFNAKTIAISITIPDNYNAMSAGDIFINPDVTVTVPSGSRWVIV